MKTKHDYLQANRELATLYGWSNLVDIIGSNGQPQALLGCPPWAASEHSRGQAQVPDWCGNWDACGMLLAMHMVSVWQLRGSIMATVESNAAPDESIGTSVQVHEHETRLHALRYAIVLAATLHLQAAK